MPRGGPPKERQAPSFQHSLAWFDHEVSSMVRQLQQVRSTVGRKGEVDTSLQDAMKVVNKHVHHLQESTSHMQDNLSPKYKARPWTLYTQDEGFYNVLQQPEPSSEVSLTDLYGLNATPPEGSTSLTKYVSERGPPPVPLGTVNGRPPTQQRGMGRPECILDFARAVPDVATEAICSSRVDLMHVLGNPPNPPVSMPRAPQRQKYKKAPPRPNAAKMRSLYIPDRCKPGRTTDGTIGPSRPLLGDLLIEIMGITQLAPLLDDLLIEFQIPSSPAIPKRCPALLGQEGGECLVMEVPDAWQDVVMVTLTEGVAPSHNLGRLSPPPWERSPRSAITSPAGANCKAASNSPFNAVGKLKIPIRDFAHGTAEGLEWTIDNVCTIHLRVAFFKEGAQKKAVPKKQAQRLEHPSEQKPGRISRAQRNVAAGAPAKAAQVIRTSSEAAETTNQLSAQAAGADASILGEPPSHLQTSLHDGSSVGCAMLPGLNDQMDGEKMPEPVGKNDNRKSAQLYAEDIEAKLLAQEETEEKVQSSKHRQSAELYAKDIENKLLAQQEAEEAVQSSKNRRSAELYAKTIEDKLLAQQETEEKVQSSKHRKSAELYAKDIEAMLDVSLGLSTL